MKPLFTNSQTLRVVATLRPPALCGCYQILIRLRPTLPFSKDFYGGPLPGPYFPHLASKHHRGAPQLPTTHRLNTHSTASAATASGFLLTA
jgi:hypothetical protein